MNQTIFSYYLEVKINDSLNTFYSSNPLMCIFKNKIITLNPISILEQVYIIKIYFISNLCKISNIPA